MSSTRQMNAPGAARGAGRSLLRAALIAASLSLAATSTHAQTLTLFPSQPTPEAPARLSASERSAPLSTKLSKRGDLSLRGMTLGEALFTIGDTWGVNIVAGAELKGQVNGVFQQAPLNEILDSILLSNGYGYRPVGQSLVILPLKDLGDVNPLFETAVIPIVHGNPTDIVTAVKLFSSPSGKVQAVASARTLLVADFPDRVQMISGYVEKLDQASRDVADRIPAGDDGAGVRVKHLKPQFVTAATLKDPIAAMLSKDGKVAVMEGDNRLLVVDHASNLQLVQQAFEQLDVARPQVRITARIYDLDLEDLKSVGINWHSAIKARHQGDDPQSLIDLDSLTVVPAPDGTTSGVLTFMNLSRNVDVTAVVNFLESCKSSRLLADPNVTTIDNQPATISIVTEIPYQELTQTSAGGNIGTTGFKEAGVKLVVTPRIASDGTILMDCTPSFSRLTGFTPGEQPQPIIDRREAKTMIRVADRQTLVVGGLRQRSDISENTGLPYLKDIKALHIGKLFGTTTTSVQETELVVFITPEIVTPYGPNKPREQAAQETADCYLDMIPQGEGCPIGAACENGAAIEPMTQGEPPAPPPAAMKTSPKATPAQKISSALGVRAPAVPPAKSTRGPSQNSNTPQRQATQRSTTERQVAAWTDLSRATRGPDSYRDEAHELRPLPARGGLVFPGEAGAPQPPPRRLPPVDSMEWADRDDAANSVQPLPPVWQPSQPDSLPKDRPAGTNQRSARAKDGSKNWLLRMLRI